MTQGGSNLVQGWGEIFRPGASAIANSNVVGRWSKEKVQAMKEQAQGLQKLSDESDPMIRTVRT